MVDEAKKQDEATKPKSADEIERAEVDAYMDPDNAGPETHNEAARKAILKVKYEAVKEEYKSLLLENEQVKGTKREDELLQQINKLFTINYKNRKFLVKELRRLGEKIEDRFVALGG